MFSKNLKYYRLKKSLSRKEFANQLNLSPMAITNYESGSRNPDMDILKRMAAVLGVRVSDFLAIRNEGLTFSHGEFRKKSTLTVTQQEYVQECVEEYFNRFMTIVEILGGEVLPEAPSSGILDLSSDHEINAISLRNHLGLANDGPIDNLIEVLENKGILVYVCDLDNDKFSGMNGFVNERPYIVVNGKMSPERNRSTMAHELAHLMFRWPSDMEESMIEEYATAISGAFLFPTTDVLRELGVHRTSISKDMILVAKEYGISLYLLVKRAYLSKIISARLEKDFYIQASSLGWRKNEPSRIAKEVPNLFEQLVYRAVNEKEISMQKGAELLKVSYEDISSNCCFVEE